MARRFRCRFNPLSFALVLMLLGSSVVRSPAETNVAAVTISARTNPPPFTLFYGARWYPMRPPAGAVTDVLTLLFFVALPVSTALALRTLFRRSKARNKRGNWGQVILGNLLVLLFLVSSGLLLGEIWFRFFVDTTDSLAFAKISERWVERHWQRNAVGVRDSIEYAPKIQSGKRRVTFIGDSFAAGHGIKNVEDRFANQLRARHPDWEIHLLANVGLDTQSEINLVRKAAVRGYEFDEVVLVYCLNDVCDLLMAPGQPFEGRLPALDQMPPWFIRGSYFLDLFYNRYQARQNPYVRNYFSFVKDGYRGEFWEAQKKRLLELRDLVQAQGGTLKVVTFPFFHALGDRYEYRFVHEELDQFWQSNSVPHLDLLPVYAGYSSRQLTVNPYDAHPNELASRLAAEAIDRFLWKSP